MEASDLQLIRDVADLTGGQPPDWTSDAAPTLQDRADPLYFIGVIGGKDVGKSSLVNALLGRPLASVSAHGEGTRRALAFAHRDDAPAVRDLLHASVPEQFDLITHDIESARRRVVVDLPDIDSVWAGHLDLTRALLRHLLFPIWVQSVEKYADAQPLQLLGKVSAGNSPENFLFVLTKADLLAARHGVGAVDELKEDYADRVTRACGLAGTPRVFAVDTLHGRFDLDALRDIALSTRSEKDVTAARHLARQQQTKTLHQWLMQQRVDDRLAAANRLLSEADAAVTERVIAPLVDRVTAGLAADGAARGGLVEPAVRSRLSYWPIVNVIDGVMGPVVSAFRGRGTPLTAGPGVAGTSDAARRVRGVFADLGQRDPQLLTLYSHSKLWENDPADRVAGALETQLETAIDRHRRTLLESAGRPAWPVRLFAPIVTLGAALWFPIVQPVLELVMTDRITTFSRQSILLAVRLLGAEYLIRSVGMLAIYFVALWMVLRWFAYRKVDRALRQSTDATHPASAVMAWGGRLLEPLRQQVQKLKTLSDRIAAVGSDRNAA